MKKENVKKSLVPVGIMLLAVVLFVMVIMDMTDSTLEQKTKSTVAMGTVITEKLYGENDSDTAFRKIENAINELENKISMRIPESTVSKLNENFSVSCDKETEGIFALCDEVRRKSDGAFDITMGKITALWKIGEEGATVPNESEIEKALQSVDGEKVKCDNGNITIEKGQKVDLGAVGKGLACDKVKDVLDGTDVDSAVISVGGSILLYGENPTADCWTVAIRDPRGEASDTLGKLKLDSGTVSTSGDYERVLVSNGKTYHHILDTKTGYPADSGLISVTVVCDSGILSDALSTAVFILGKEKGMALLKEYGVDGVLVDEEKNVFLTDGLEDKFELTNSDYALAGEEK